jgi:hypothetical protein
MNIASATGRCLCGAVTFTATDVEPHFHACHCSMCRRHAGGPTFSVNVGGIEFGGEAEITRYQSSDWAERGFCRHCGSHIFYRLKKSGQYMIAAGAFDDPTPFVLSGEIYIDHKPAGYAFAGDHPRETEAEIDAKFAAG